MIKSQVMARIAAKMTQVPEQQVYDGVNYLLDLMSERLSQGMRIEIRGFGSFSTLYRPERQAHNPKTGEKIITTAKYIPHFKPGKLLRDRIQQSRNNYEIVSTDP